MTASDTATPSVAVHLPAPDDVDHEHGADDPRPEWGLTVGDVRAVTVVAAGDVVDVRIERGNGNGTSPFTGVHARSASLTPDDAERLGRCLIAAAADSRARSTR